MSGSVNTADAKGIRIEEAILLKKAGHEDESILRWHREDKFEFINVSVYGNMGPLFDNTTFAMNVIRMHIVPNFQLYQAMIAEFAGEEREFQNLVTPPPNEQYGISVKDDIIFSLSPYDSRMPMALLPTDTVTIKNCVTFTEKRIKLAPLSCQMGVQLLREIDEGNTRQQSV